MKKLKKQKLVLKKEELEEKDFTDYLQKNNMIDVVIEEEKLKEIFDEISGGKGFMSSNTLFRFFRKDLKLRNISPRIVSKK